MILALYIFLAFFSIGWIIASWWDHRSDAAIAEQWAEWFIEQKCQREE